MIEFIEEKTEAISAGVKLPTGLDGNLAHEIATYPLGVHPVPPPAPVSGKGNLLKCAALALFFLFKENLKTSWISGMS